MSTFRDAIANAVLTGAPGSLMPLALEAADDVLAMPEMEAIRKALLLDTICECGDPIMCGCDMQLPVSVIAWALGGDQ